MNYQGVGEQYALKSDEEILLLAAQRKDLTDEAQSALGVELEKRGLPLPREPERPVVRRPIPPRADSVVIVRPRRWYDSQFARFPLHVLLVYAMATIGAPRLAFFTQRITTLVLDRPNDPFTPLSFFTAHLFVLTVGLAIVGGVLCGLIQDRAANFVWMVPSAILVLKLLTYNAARSVLFGATSSAFAYYFRSDFRVANEPLRYLAQLRVTAPFYAGLVYSVVTWLLVRTGLAKAVEHRMTRGTREL